MKPINFEKKAVQNTARVKMLIKSRLSWLSGYPHFEDNKLVWVVSASGFCCDQAIEVDSKILSTAQRTVNTLYRDYPKALPRVVGDTKVWYQRCCDYIDYAKELALAKSDGIFSLFDKDHNYRNDRNKDLNLDHEKVVTAQLSWKHFIDRSNLNKALCFFSTHQRIDNSISSKDLINLIGLHCINPKKSHKFIDFALSCINQDTTCHAKFEYLSPYLKSIKTKNIKKRNFNFNVVPFPKTDNHQILQNFIHSLNTLNKSKIIRALLILDQLPLKEQFNQWQNWWNKVNQVCEKIKNHTLFSVDIRLEQVQVLQDQLKRIDENKPSDLNLFKVLAAIEDFSESKPLCSALVLLINTLKSKQTLFPSGQSFVIYIHELIKWERFKPSKVSEHLLALNRFIKHVEHADEEFPWSQIPQYNWSGIDCVLLENVSIAGIKSFFKNLTSLYLQGKIQLKTKELKSIHHLLQCNYTPIEITQILKTLRKNKVDDPLPKDVVQIAQGLSLENAEIFKLYQLHEKLYDTELFDECLLPLFALFKQFDALDLAKCLFFEMPITKIFRIHSLTQVIITKSGADKVPAPPKIDFHHEDWISQYPESLRKSIALLNSIHSDSQKQIHNICKNIWWTKQMIETELTSLKSMTKSENPELNKSINKRIAKFENQLNNPQSITPEQVIKIINKIQVKINHALFAQWELMLEKQFLMDWSLIFTVASDQIPKWLADPQVVAKLLPIMSFNSSSKNLAIKVIKERIKGPYDFFNRNQNNKTFIKKLKSDGINWSIKINDYSYDAKNGQKVTISVEKDPLEILDMGGHFGTCLSPGDMNYFSVFSNIADANKVVLYARNLQNKVIGRVLLGITDQGGLQIFNRYTHHKDFEFHKHAQIFINEIAKETGLIITNNGTITPLCSNDWYDDGPENITHGIDCFNDGSTFRQSLTSLSGDAFEKILREAIKPKKMNALIFSLLLNVPELKDNKNLFQSLLKFSLTLPHLADDDLMKLYYLANSYHLGSELYAAHRKRLFNFLLKRINNYWYIFDDIKLIAAHHPSDALKMIKAQAKLNNMDWKKQPIYEAIDPTVMALKRLGRHQLAETIARMKN